MNKFLLLIKFTLLCAAVALSGCVINQPAMPNDPHYAPAMAPAPVPSAASNGSLYHPTSSLDLFSDRVANRVGDILTVVLQENTTSNKSSAVDISKEAETVIPGAGLMLGSPVDIETNISTGTEFKGEGDTSQSNNLNGSIAVSIVEVWPNGTLVVRGEKWLTLNQGNEFIRLTGLVRPDDVSSSNTVMSTKVANARITYSATGQMADTQQVGWGSRFFNSPYWPF